jgi:hypothetical protein
MTIRKNKLKKHWEKKNKFKNQNNINKIIKLISFKFNKISLKLYLKNLFLFKNPLLF